MRRRRCQRGSARPRFSRQSVRCWTVAEFRGGANTSGGQSSSRNRFRFLSRAISNRQMLRRYWPILLFELYLNGGLLLFLFGPLDYGIRHPILVPAYLLASHCCLFVGFLLALRARPGSYSEVVPEGALFRFAILSVSVIAVANFSTITTSLLEIPSLVLRGLSNLSLAYGNKFDLGRTPVAVYRFLVWFHIGSVLFLPLLVALWCRSSVIIRLVGCLAAALHLGFYAAMGTTNEVANYCIAIPALVLAAYPRLLRGDLLSFRTVLGGSLATLTLGLAVLYFVLAKGTAEAELRSVPGAEIRYQGLLDLPPGISSSVIMLTSYLVQGYHGLDLSFSEPFVWAYGAGHSQLFLGSIIHDAEGHSALDLSYPSRVNEHEEWDRMGNWHSIYPWMASDLTFAGTLVFVFAVGFLYGLAWLDWSRCRNPLAFGMFHQLFLIQIGRAHV